MSRFKMLLGMVAVVVAVAMVGCGGKQDNPLAPDLTMREYAQEESGPTAAAKPVVGRNAVVIAKVFYLDVQDIMPDSVQFSPSISGRALKFEYGAVIERGEAHVELPPGYYVARVLFGGQRPQGERVWEEGGRWASISIQAGHEIRLELRVGEQARIVTDIPPGIVLTKNMAVADASASNPTAVRGARSVKIASVVIQTSKTVGSRLHAIVVHPDNPVFGRVFQNIYAEAGNDLPSGYTQGMRIGNSIGTIGGAPTWIEPKDPFFLDIPAGKFLVVHLYADVSISATEEDLEMINRDNDSVLIVSAISTNFLARYRTSTRLVGNLQRVYIAQHGTLEIEPLPLLSSTLPDSTRSQVIVSKFSVTARAENMSVSGLSWHVPVGGSFMLGSFRLYRNGALASHREYTINFDAAGSTGIITVVFNQDEVFAKGVKVIFEARDDTNVTPEALAKNGGKWELSTVLLPVIATGMTSGKSTVTPRLGPQTLSR